MLPFVGDINGVVGVVGFIPLDFVLPMILTQASKIIIDLLDQHLNHGGIVTCAFSSIRKLVLDANQFKLFDGEVVD